MTTKKSEQPVKVYAWVNLGVGPEEYTPGDAVELPAWQAEDLKARGYVGSDPPPEDADGSDPNVQVEIHQRSRWTKEPIVRGRKTPIPGETEQDLVGEGGYNAASPWL